MLTVLTTKDKILFTAIELFNQKGYKNVSIKEVADAMGISPGNLTYHFKTKESLIGAIYEAMRDETQAFVLPAGAPTLLHFEEMYTNFYYFQHQYSFFFTDMLEIVQQYPAIKKMNETRSAKFIADGNQLFDYYVRSGRILPPPDNISYPRLTHMIWMMGLFWMSQNKIVGIYDDTLENYLTHLWNIILPHTTELGKREYAVSKFCQNRELANITNAN